MATLIIPRPRADEHIEYYGRYISLVPDGDLIALLRDQALETGVLLTGVTADRASYAYAPGKWTVKQVVGHLIDTERVMGNRALWFARDNAVDLPGFDENTWAANNACNDRTLGDLLEEFQVVRAATIEFAKHLDEGALMQRGKANGHEISVRALLYIIAGHERHHVALLRERYLTT